MEYSNDVVVHDLGCGSMLIARYFHNHESRGLDMDWKIPADTFAADHRRRVLLFGLATCIPLGRYFSYVFLAKETFGFVYHYCFCRS